MSKTQLEIIDIIKDYMDKSLKKWCLVELWLLTEKKYRIQTVLNAKEIWLVYEYALINSDNDIIYKTYYEIYKILWHYDISVIEKYILLKQDKSWTTINLMKNWEYKEIVCKWWITIAYPNKPLNLYTDQENKDLLKLLKELQS